MTLPQWRLAFAQVAEHHVRSACRRELPEAVILRLMEWRMRLGEQK